MKTTMKSISLSVLMLVFVLNQGFSQKISYSDSWGKQGFTLESTKNTSVLVNYSLEELLIDDIDIDGKTLREIHVPGIFLPNNEGAPNLPGTGRYVALPQGANVSYKITASRTEVFNNIDIAPAPRIPLDTETGPMKYEKEDKIYLKNELYPKQTVTISDKVKIRGVDVVMLGVTPFQYNPVSKELIVYRDLKVEIEFIGGNGHIGEDRLRNRWWEPIVKDALLNPLSLPEIDFTKNGGPTDTPDYEYIIISPDDPVFLSWADSVKSFRTLQGIRTGIVTTTEIGGNTTTAIETYVNNAYNTWGSPPAAVLLLGDYGTSGSTVVSPIYNSYCVSDNIYADVDGDHLPDIVFARMTAQNATHLETMITKFLDYERNPPISYNFYDHPITALGWQTERWFQICSETVGGFLKNELGKTPVRINAVYGGDPTSDPWSTATNTSTVLSYFGPSGLGYIPATPDELGGFSGGTASDVSNAINSGAFILQHRDHGGETGWGEPAFQSSNIDNLTNSDLPWIFSINCLTGKYNISGECFAEKFHRYTQGGHNSGALGITAASEVSYSFVNDTYVWGLYDNMWPDFMPSETADPESRGILPAFGNAAGKIFLEQSSWPYNTSNKEVTYNLFHHHGDAFTVLYSEVPQYLTVNHAAALLSGATSFTVSANAGSFVALTVNGDIVGTANGTGSPVPITIPAQTPGDIMIVTVTKQNYYRYSSNVNIIPPSGPYVTYNNHLINDASGNNDGEADFGEDILLDMTLENLGSVTANDVNATLICSDAFVTITDNSESFGSINASSTSTMNDAYSFTIADDIPDQYILSFELQVDGNSDETWISYFSLTVNAPSLEYGNMIIDDNVGGDGNGRLDPGETADITVPVMNNGSSDSPVASALLSTISSYVTVNSGSSSLGVISAGGNVNVVFNISTDPLTPIGTAVDLTIEVDAGNYDITNTFYQSIGLVLEDWETGTFSSYPWTLSGTADWTITDVDPYEGTYCTQSGTITHSQTSEMEVELYVTTADDISFYRKVSSESSYDYLRFYIDGTEIAQWAGDVAWSQVSYPVTIGTHTFKWAYEKDGSVSTGSDCGWVDYIIFPPISPPPDPANIEVNPDNFEVTLATNDQTTQVLAISNMGEADLEFSISKYYNLTKSPKDYCTSVGGGGDEFISNVNIGNIDNSSAQTNYGDYTGMSTLVVPEMSYPITITNGDPNWSSDQCGIWVDWNQNEDFSDDTPIVVSGTPGVGPYTANIIPPVDALGGPTRMRLQIIYSATPDPCTASFSYGEVEDYTLVVDNDFTDWLSFTPVSGIVAGSNSTNIDVTFNSADMDDGDYFADLIITSNDPVEPEVTVPCTLHVGDMGFNVNLTVLLEGAYNNSDMNTILIGQSDFPKSQPFNAAPWYYSGTESVVFLPNSDMVDWVLVELRDAVVVGGATGASIIATQAGFLLKNGKIVGMDGSTPLFFDATLTNDLFVAIHSRNHLTIISNNALTGSGGLYDYDFSTGSGQVYGGTAGYNYLGSSKWGMVSGDGNCDGKVTMSGDTPVWELEAGESGYILNDHNLDGQVDNIDKDDYLLPNIGKESQMPE